MPHRAAAQPQLDQNSPVASPLGRQVLIRWVLVRDAEDAKEPQAFLCTNLDAEPTAILVQAAGQSGEAYKVLSQDRCHAVGYVARRSVLLSKSRLKNRSTSGYSAARLSS